MTDASTLSRLAALGLLRSLLDSLAGVTYGLPIQIGSAVSAQVYLEDDVTFEITVRPVAS